MTERFPAGRGSNEAVPNGSPTADGELRPVELATVELLGALTYGQLRAFETTTRAVRLAPGARRADRLAGFAVREHAGYVLLRDRLTELTDLAAAVIDRQRDRFDDYFDQVAVDDWLTACTFFAVGLPIAADFTRAIAPAVDERTAAVIVEALADRDAFEQFAADELAAAIASDEEAEQRARTLVAEVLGRALTQFQGAIAGTDALDVLLAGDGGDGSVAPGASEPYGDGSDAVVRRMAVDLIDHHRRRMLALGLEDLD